MHDTDCGRPDARRAEPGRSETSGYEIRVQGHLTRRRTAWFDGLSSTVEIDGTTVIHCPALDQSALHGVLQKVRDMGLPLISVTRSGPGPPDVPPDVPPGEPPGEPH